MKSCQILISVNALKLLAMKYFYIDGHNMEEIVATLDKIRASHNNLPKAIIADTIKGRGVSFMENQLGWHGVAPNDEEYKQAMEELDGGG